MQLKEYKLGDIAEIVNGSTPSTSCSHYYDGDIVWITPKDLSEQNTKYIKNGGRNITKEGFDSCSTHLIPEYNILLTSRAPIGLLAINQVACCTNQGFKNLIVNKDIVDVDYLYYYLKYHIAEIETLGTGTTFKEVSKASMEKYTVSLPNIEEQKKVSSILSALDAKISLNKQINQNLEALARQLYDYWFVQFDFPNEEGKPYKSSGGKMVYNPILKREIPDRWEVKEIHDICNVRRGASPRPIDEYMDETHNGMPWLKISDATADNSPFVVSIKEYIIEEGIPKSVEITEGTLVVTNSATPGMPKFIYKHCCVHDGWLVLTGYKNEEKFYLYYAIEDMRTKLERMASGSIFKNLRTEYLQQYKILLPNNQVLLNFTEVVSVLLDKSLRLAIETNSLTKQRDELLPLLMNGQVNFDLSDD